MTINETQIEIETKAAPGGATICVRGFVTLPSKDAPTPEEHQRSLSICIGSVEGDSSSIVTLACPAANCTEKPSSLNLPSWSAMSISTNMLAIGESPLQGMLTIQHDAASIS